MGANTDRSDNIENGIIMRKPERLWVFYCFALMIVLLLIFISYLQSRTMVERALLTTQAIKRSNEQILIMQDIVAAADRLVSAADADFGPFDESLRQFETNYADMLAAQRRTGLFPQDPVDLDPALHQKIDSFLVMAQQYASAPADQRFGLNIRLKQLYLQSGVHNDLLKTASMITAKFAAQTRRFATLQNGMLIISGLVLLAEAIFIFKPAQRSVLHSLGSMRKTTRELRASQYKLRQKNAQLEHMVRHDPLTGLPNRTSLIETLEEIKTDRSRHERRLLLIGLDGFKSVNDTYGQDYGDALLIAFGDALRRTIDNEHHIARVGGDEFILISDEPERYLIPRIMRIFQEPFEIRGRRIPIHASIGHIAIGDPTHQDHDILADAEIAMQAAKNQGGHCAQAFTQKLRDDLGMMTELQMALSDAIGNGEIEPWFQPQMRLSDGHVHGAEVLVRWRHPTLGLLTPDVFLPAAERAGLTVELDHAVWRTAMQFAKHWQHTLAWHPVISLNAAPDTIADPNLVERMLHSIQMSGLEAEQVIVEVLETVLIGGKDDLAAVNIDSLAECGIALELDDFGTGYASLSKLTQLPLAGIKLDRSLIAPLPGHAAGSVVRAILALAAELGIYVIAEGIEEKEQATYLHESGCPVGQGYCFARPMPASEFAIWLERNMAPMLKQGPNAASMT